MNMSEDERKEFMEKERSFHSFHDHFHRFFGEGEEPKKEDKNE